MATNPSVQEVHAEVPFNATATGTSYRPTKIVFEMDDRKDEQQTSHGAVRVRRYPGDISHSLNLGGFGGGPMTIDDMGYSYVVTEGNLYFTTEVRERYIKGSLVLSGSVEVELPYPVVRGLNVEANGKLYSARGTEIDPAIRFDDVAQKLMIGRPTYGKIDYEYYTNYRVARYFPTKHSDFEIYFEVDERNYGEILAFPRMYVEGMESSIVSFQVRPPPAVSGEFEIYRVVSVGIINQEGSWEKPTGWPTTGTFPDKTATKDRIDPSASFMQVERTHIIGYLCLGDNNQTSAKMTSMESSTGARLATEIGRDGGKSVEYSLALGSKVSAVEDYVKKNTARYASVREVVYEVPWAKPYDEAPPELAIAVLVTEANGVRMTSATNTTYRRLLTVRANKPPVSPIAEPSRETINSITYDDQANRLNAYLYQAYSMVDWAAIRASLAQRFNTETYGAITFDSSVPVK